MYYRYNMQKFTVSRTQDDNYKDAKFSKQNSFNQDHCVSAVCQDLLWLERAVKETDKTIPCSQEAYTIRGADDKQTLSIIYVNGE